MAKEKKFDENFRGYHEHLETMMRDEDTRNSQRQKFHESQYVEWRGGAELYELYPADPDRKVSMSTNVWTTTPLVHRPHQW